MCRCHKKKGDCKTQQQHRCSSTTKYVQGGRCDPGDGSRCHPYNSLALAEADTSWTTLVVLPSSCALDGGILMRPGTKLQGDENPLCGALSGNTPTITNTSNASNGGNGVVIQSGDVCIQNVYFQNTWSSAINFSNARNLSVKNVLITGHNQGAETYLVPYTLIPPSTRNLGFVGGIHGICSNDGTTNVCNTVIANNFVGNGIVSFAVNASTRTLNVQNSEFVGLGFAVPAPSNVQRFQAGVDSSSVGIGAKNIDTLTKCYFHDYSQTTLLNRTNMGYQCVSYDGAVSIGHVKKCVFKNLFAPPLRQANHVFYQAYTDPTAVPPGIRSSITGEVVDCTFAELPTNATSQATAVFWFLTNAISAISIKKNIIRNVFDNFISLLQGNSLDTSSISGNNTTGFEAFLFAAAQEDGSYSVPSNNIQTVTVEDNNFVGGDNFGAIIIIPDNTGTLGNWASLNINATRNCFDGQGSGFGGLVGFSFGPDDAGNATINAHQNNITGYSFDIFDSGANVNYLADLNWWGQATGPQNVVGGTGAVVTNPFLVTPIICPTPRCCGAIPPVQTNALPLSTEDKLSKICEKMQYISCTL